MQVLVRCPVLHLSCLRRKYAMLHRVLYYDLYSALEGSAGGQTKSWPHKKAAMTNPRTSAVCTCLLMRPQIMLVGLASGMSIQSHPNKMHAQFLFVCCRNICAVFQDCPGTGNGRNSDKQGQCRCLPCIEVWDLCCVAAYLKKHGETSRTADLVKMIPVQAHSCTV